MPLPGTGIIAALANGFWAAAEWIGWKREKQALDNSPEMQARAQGQTDQQIKDAAAKEIATGNVADLRKDLAE